MPSKMPLFELCAPSLAAALAADRCGADRIELCTNLSVGGVTPDDELVASVIRAVSIPVHVLIRPRAGDFVFSHQEFALMERQIEAARRAGAAGVAIGILRSDGRIDVARSRTLAKLAGAMKVTFHRAFDETRDRAKALEDVILTGADTLLTSGGAADALTGAEAISRLHTQARGRLEVMAGGGVRLANLGELIRRSGVYCVHGSLTRPSGANGHSNGVAALEEDLREALRVLRDACSDTAGVRVGS